MASVRTNNDLESTPTLGGIQCLADQHHSAAEKVLELIRTLAVLEKMFGCIIHLFI